MSDMQSAVNGIGKFIIDFTIWLYDTNLAGFSLLAWVGFPAIIGLIWRFMFRFWTGRAEEKGQLYNAKMQNMRSQRKG